MESTPGNTAKPEAILNSLPQAALLVDDVGYIPYVNEACATIWEHEASLLVGQNWMGLDTDLTLFRWKQMWKEGQTHNGLTYTTYVLTEHDLLRPVEVRMLPLNKEEAVLLLEPIQPRQIQQAQFELLSKEKGYWHYNHLNQSCFFSASAMRLLGVEEATDVQMPLAEVSVWLQPILGKQPYETLLDTIRQSVRGGQAFEREILVDGKTLMLQGVSERNALHTSYVVGVLSRVHSGASSASAEVDFFSRFSVEHTNELIYWVNADGYFVYTNQAFCRRLGVNASDLEGRRGHEFIKQRSEAQRAAIWDTLREQKQIEGQAEMVSHDERVFPVTYVAYYLKTDQQELACIFVRDAGDKIRQERLLELTKFSTDKSPQFIFWTRPDASFVYVNERGATQLQYKQSDFEEMKVMQIAPYFDVKARKAFWKRLRTERFFNAEYELTRKDGSVFTVSARVNYIQFEGEEIACSFCRDITRHKLQQRRRLLSEFTVDHSNELILWVHPNGEIHFANQTFLARTGYELEEAEGMSIVSFFYDYTEKERRKHWAKLRKNKQFGIESRLTIKSGHVIPVYTQFNYLIFEGQEFKCVYIRDWTKKRERETLLELAEAALASAREAILRIEADETVSYLNAAMLDLIGGTEEDWRGRKLNKVIPGLSLSKLNTTSAVEHNLPTREGYTVYLEWSCSELRVNRQTYYNLLGRNITERVQRRKELERAYGQIEEMSLRLQDENLVLREERDFQYDINNIVTASPAYQKVLQQIGQVADTDTTVLITGETGTGKELLARAVHKLSDRKAYTLIKVNCAALPENLIESELFGHEKGAFTGAQERKKGRFELANKGTIFLDEVGELPLALQAKLLRVLQEGEFERVGGTETIEVDVRLIAATNRDLAAMVKEKQFRADLFYRINVFPIRNMPLRERPEDIKVLTEYFAKRFAKEQGKKITRVSSTDLKKLQNYAFPGNVRELENIIERAVVLCNSDVLRIPFEKQNIVDLQQDHFLTFEEMQRQYIIEALKKTGGRVTGPEGAGRLLGMNDRTLMSKIRKFEIAKREYIV